MTHLLRETKLFLLLFIVAVYYYCFRIWSMKNLPRTSVEEEGGGGESLSSIACVLFAGREVEALGAKAPQVGEVQAVAAIAAIAASSTR